MMDDKKTIEDSIVVGEIVDNTTDINNDGLITSESIEQVQPDNSQIEVQCYNKNNIEEDRTYYRDLITRSNFYLPERTELLDIALQYNQLLENIHTLNGQLDGIKTEVLKASVIYEEFKRKFAAIIDACPWFTKLYYTVPIYDDYEDDDVWISQWFKTIQTEITDNDRKNLRNYINKNLFNSVYALPKEVYCYKANSKEIEGVNDETTKFVFILASRIARYIKYIKDTSDLLRGAMQKALSAKPMEPDRCFEKVEILSEEVINADLESTSESKGIDQYCEVIKKYKLLNLGNSKVIDNQKEFISFARKTYQEVINFQNTLSSISKQVYTSSLSNIYKLYGEISISHKDLKKIQSAISDVDEKSKLIASEIESKILEMQELVETYLNESYKVRPLKEIHEGVNVNTLDVNWYDTSGSEPAPSKDFVECISSISDPGFAKYNLDGTVEFVTKPARIFVYNKQLINADANESTNE